MDVEKWYPSMIAQPSAKEIREMVVESEIDFKGFDLDVVSQYLGEYLTNEEIKEEDMEEIVYMKKEKAKRKSKKNLVKNVTKKHVPKPQMKTMNKSNIKIKKNQCKLKLKQNAGSMAKVNRMGKTIYKNVMKNLDNIKEYND